MPLMHLSMIHESWDILRASTIFVDCCFDNHHLGSGRAHSAMAC